MLLQKTFTENLTAIKITKEDAILLGINPEVDEQRGELKSFGPWHIPVSYKAICMDTLYQKGDYGQINPVNKTVFGIRTLTNVRQGGYELEGRVSIGGKKYTAFTSSQLFEVDGKLIDVAVIQARYTPFPKD